MVAKELTRVKGSWILAGDLFYVGEDEWYVNSIEELIFDSTYRLTISRGTKSAKTIVYDHKQYWIAK